MFRSSRSGSLSPFLRRWSSFAPSWPTSRARVSSHLPGIGSDSACCCSPGTGGTRDRPMHMVHRFERLPSTQDEVHRLAAAGAPAGTVVVSAEQDAGRGSRGRRWASPIGGLWLSFLCRPARSVGVEVLSLRVGLAAAEALAEVGGLPPVSLKWPNDLIIN